MGPGRLRGCLRRLAVRHAQELRRHDVCPGRGHRVCASGVDRAVDRMALATVLYSSRSVLFTQSRQAVIGLVAAVFVVVFRSRQRPATHQARPAARRARARRRHDRRAGPDRVGQPVQLVLPADHLVPGLDDRVVDRPVFGAGLRWWYTDRFPVRFQPPNAEIEVLTSAGVRRPRRLPRALFVGSLVVSWQDARRSTARSPWPCS